MYKNAIIFHQYLFPVVGHQISRQKSEPGPLPGANNTGQVYRSAEF